MAHLLSRVKSAGYEVADKRNAHGTRIISIVGGTSWCRMVVAKNAPREFLEHVVSRLQWFANNPLR